ncbi:hypothetical protein QRY40_04850 [Campylobacter jejuni]|nr:hypothetical protein [Campylobacter jejuni]EFC30264.1 hypothetical protein C1336_000330029 [Campylobacter jejuni subsp. jejuni 1336]MEA8950755.1 hypothetical protein [Campylobacter jejuni]
MKCYSTSFAAYTHTIIDCYYAPFIFVVAPVGQALRQDGLEQ